MNTTKTKNMNAPSIDERIPSKAIITINKRVENIIIGQSVLKKLLGTTIGVIKTVIARTKARFAILDPTMFPKAISGYPDKAD